MEERPLESAISATSAVSATAAASEVATQILESSNPSGKLESLSSEARIAGAAATQAEQANTLRSIYGYVLLGFVLFQIIAADVIFVLYVDWGRHWNVPSTTLNVWLGATVVQVLGVVVIVVHYLFPNRDSTKS